MEYIVLNKKVYLAFFYVDIMAIKHRYFGTLYSFENSMYANVIRTYLHSATQAEFENNLTTMGIEFKILDRL